MIEESHTPLAIKGITIPAERGFSQERIPLPEGEYRRAQLLKALLDEWIPLFECHKCGRFSYCKFAQPHSTNPNRARDIQCGVVVTALDNLLLVSWSRLLTYTTEQLQRFFNGLFHFSQFVFDTEITIGNYVDPDHLNWAGEDLARREFGFISHLRVHLDRFASEFRELDDFGSVGRWIVVEGDAEKAFLERLGELRFYTIYVSGVEKYGGKGNATPTRFRLYVESLQNRGYSVAVQGDRDNSKKNRLERFVSDGLIEKDLAFPFPKDFEGSFPPPVLHHALHLSGYDVSLEWLTGIMTRSSHPPVTRKIQSKVGKRVNKVELARRLAEVVSHNWVQIYEKHSSNEIVRWLSFLRTGEPA